MSAQSPRVDFIQAIEQGENIVSQPPPKTEPPKFIPHWSLTFLVGYLYFIQGIILSIPATMPYIYPELPGYDIRSIFALAVLPFSFKFITAPVIEKFTHVPYGKRKFWIITSQICTSIIIFVMSFFTEQKFQMTMAVSMFFAVFFICLQDISLDAMAIKQLRTPHLVAMLQAILQTTGIIFGSLVLLKLSSHQFAEKIGFKEAISNPATIFKTLSFIILIPTIIIHFLYKQKLLQSELRVRQKSLWKIVKYYRIFCDTGSQYCRYFFVFIFFHQGLNFFFAGYDYELISAGFQRDDFNTIGNMVQIVVTVLAIVISPQIERMGILKSMMAYLIGCQVIAVFLLAYFPLNYWVICGVAFLLSLFGTFEFILVSIIVNRFPVSGLSGMFITMTASGSNFGRLGAIHLKLIGHFGFYSCSIFGLIIQAAIILAYPQIYAWMERGDILIDKELLEDTEEELQILGIQQSTGGQEKTFDSRDILGNNKDPEIQIQPKVIH